LSDPFFDRPVQPDHRFSRRTLIKGGIAAGVALGAGAGVWALTQGGPPAVRARPGSPNILVIIVDQLRFPRWFSPARHRIGLPPNLARLRLGAVSFEHHYTASNDCSPSRAALLTGLYTHQTGCLLTGASTLHAGFPTWGTMLREQGYQTYWYGKWHLTQHDNRWTAAAGGPALDSYGFDGGTFPSPDGAPGQGWRVDPHVVAQFDQWFAQEGGGGPWCTTVSLVNPHDIAWWYRRTDRVPPESHAPRTVAQLPPNFETPAQLLARRKPTLQRSLQETSAQSFGEVPFTGPEVHAKWLPFLDLYVKLQRRVDGQIGHVLRTLHSRPEVAANTVIVFTSDHGEYGASHGLRGKGAAVYEEGIRVPLLIKDPRGKLTRAPERPRTQLTSSVDLAPFLLTVASGGDEWRRDARYAHLAHRFRLERLLADPTAAGRPYVLHATDELVTEFAVELYAAQAPLHIVALRTADAKFAMYSHWARNGIEPLAHGQQRELYDYRTHAGRLEIDNVAGHSPLEERLDAMLRRAVADELRAPLPAALAGAREAGFADYLNNARRGVINATNRRRKLLERQLRHPRQRGSRR
jgi:arylsulfatase A-like enzyme